MDPPAPETDVRVVRIGGDGDGIADHAGTPLYVPFALPGELVRVDVAGKRGAGRAAAIREILEPSADRQAPLCAHFGRCGGCSLQHWRDDALRAWKRDQVAVALRRAGFSADVAVGGTTPPRTRRRMDLALRREGQAIRVGLHPQRGQGVVDLGECHVVHPGLFTLLPGLRILLARLAAFRREGSAVGNLLDSGVDLLLRTDATPTLADRSALVAFARAHDLPRIAWALNGGTPEPVCVLRPPVTRIAGKAVHPAPGAFLQASAEGEQAIVAAVVAGLPPGRPRIAELYAGVGTLTHALASRARVAAFEGDAAAAAALRASGHADTHHRDLARQPLGAAELRRFGGVLLDPPHAGAAMQMPTIASAKVPRVIYVSCNPQALARDARVLAQAGYACAGATLVDQFIWSARIESVSVFTIGEGG